MTEQRSSDTGVRIQGLDGLLKAAEGNRLPPVEHWNPPYCGDIGMRIRADGTWLYQNSPIGRKALVVLFSRILRRDADGRTYLVTPVEKVDVTVDDAPFLAVEMQVENQGRDQQLIFRTNVDDEVTAGRDHPIRVAEANGEPRPYVRVRDGLEALILRPVFYQLVDLAVERTDHGGARTMGVWSGGAFFVLGDAG